MNYTLAYARLKLASAADTDPALSDAELDLCLGFAAVVDVNGKGPGDDGYTPTYTPNLLNLAIAQAWETKAGKLGDLDNFAESGDSFDPDKRRAFCLNQAERYRKKVVGSFALTGRTRHFDYVLGLACNTVIN